MFLNIYISENTYPALEVFFENPSEYLFILVAFELHVRRQIKI